MPAYAALLLAALALVAATGHWSPAYCQEKKVTDQEITRAVEMELWTDEAVDPNMIDVNTVNGIVTLTGTTNNMLATERAAEICQVVVGVRGVVNRIQVEPRVERTDAELKQAVQEALLLDPATDSYEIDVEIRDGAVTLTGTTDSWQEKQLAATVAKGVRGVTGITNDIQVDYKTERSDYEIQQEVKAKLANDVRVDDFLVEVEVENGEVELSGTVGSLNEKSTARLDAWVAGVTEVDAGDLEVEWWARDKMRRKQFYSTRGDEEIKKAVEDAMLYDPRVLSFKPEVSVDDGAVTLTGTVSDLAAKKAAEQDAKNVVGVWRVVNLIKVRPEVVPSDETLKDRVTRALAEDPFIEHFRVDLDAHAGWVYLTGDVNTTFERSRAEHVVESVKGVLNVVNHLRVSDVWTWKPDWEIKEDVQKELFWSPYVDENDVEVSVDEGVVTLTGTVENWSERNAAGDNAYEAGAKEVRNMLVVRNRYYGPYDWHLLKF